MATQDVLAGVTTIELAEGRAGPETATSSAAPAHWRVARLGDVVTLQRGKDLPENERIAGPYPVVGSSGVVGYHNVRVADGPGVLVGRSGSVGRVTWVHSDYWPLNTALWVSDFHESDREFAFHLLTHMDLGGYAAGVSVPTLNRNLVHPLPVNMPPLPEQRAIARALRSVQAAIQARRREVALERERKAALMQHLLTHGTRGEATRLTEIGEMPESWRVVELGDYSAKPEYGYTASATDEAIGPRFLRITDIQEAGVDWRSVPYCACDEKTARELRLAQGDIVIARIGATTGKSFLISDCPAAVFASYLIRVRAKPGLEAAFLHLFCQTDTYWRQIDQSKGGRLKFGVNIPILQGIVMPLPPPSEQHDIADILTACDTRIAAMNGEAMLLDELFRALLDALMTGRLSALPLVEGDATVGTPATEGAVSV